MSGTEASGQEILEWLKVWTQAQRLCTDGIDVGTRDSLLKNIAYFENGGRFHGDFEKHPDAEEWPMF